MTGPADNTAHSAAFIAKAVQVANANAKMLTGAFAEVQELVDQHEWVIALWQDDAEPHGVGMLTIKGHARLRAIVAANRPMNMSWTAVPCTCAEQAEALRQVAGENDARH